MPHSRMPKQNSRIRPTKARLNAGSKPETRYTVGLPSPVATQVERYAQTVDASMSKAIAALVRLGLQSQEDRKREFFKRLKENLGNDAPGDWSTSSAR